MQETLLTSTEINLILEARRQVDLPGDTLSHILKAQDAKTFRVLEAQLAEANRKLALARDGLDDVLDGLDWDRYPELLHTGMAVLEATK